MQIFQGLGASAGIAAGLLKFLDPAVSDSPSRISSPGEELLRFEEARNECLNVLSAEIRIFRGQKEEGAREAAALLKAHKALLQDEVFAAAAAERIREKKVSAEEAVKETGEAFALGLEALGDESMKARSADIRDVTLRVLEQLASSAKGQPAAEQRDNAPEENTPKDSTTKDSTLKENTTKNSTPKENRQETAERNPDMSSPESPRYILAAEDCSPSAFLKLDRSLLAGLITCRGSRNSHTAILARSFGIPYVCGLETLPGREFSGLEFLINGETGEIIGDPEPEHLRSLKEKQDRSAKSSVSASSGASAKGQSSPVFYCNISTPEEVELVRQVGGLGIGLFRTDFLFLASDHAPSEEEQFSAFRQVLAGMQGQPVVIRTLDIGSDKSVPYLSLPQEANPALGLRGIRLCLRHPELFLPQLRAIYRASVYGNASILFPMVDDLAELRQVRTLCGKVQEELASKGIPFRKNVPLGIMVETPAAVFLAEDLAKEADFFSIGTNDLTQYTLACDRDYAGTDLDFEYPHPAVVQALRLTARAAGKAGISVSICGEMAADPALYPLFTELGIDILSVAPAMLQRLRS